MEALGIDIGGTGIKGAPVDTTTGALLTERFRLRTPQPATPEAMTQTVAKVVEHFNWQGPVGAGFPAIIKHGEAHSAANIDPSWIGRNVRSMFEDASGTTFTVLNDADVAGMAEMRFGAGRGRSGVVLVLTLGTGIGTALFTDGHLVPNTEFGHIEIDGKLAESRAADSAREREELSWKKWARRLDRYLDRLAFYLSPELIIIGGGVSKKHDKFLPLLEVDLEIEPAQLRNEAGIVGAAAAAAASTGQERPTVVGAAPELQV
ncbi:MAG: ROK family protein [Gemmatimonadetes bacterium]|jgi:polyphosphate glucokinase|nr:ROK family protein [Gemmatimonadota bacterium]MBT7861439.1 ROK family protein [Gemmatimonadota bacterium]